MTNNDPVVNEVTSIYSVDEALEASVKYFDGDELAAEKWLEKYALYDNNDNLLEKTPDDMHRRLAREFARLEVKKYKNTNIKPLSEEEIYSLFKDFRWIIPQGSVMYGLGNPYKIVSISNCVVCESPGDSYGYICKTDQELVQLSKRRCGVGIDLSELRPSTAPTNNSSKTSTGVASWLERYSNSCREVGQNNRRGALLLSLHILHPDAFTFATIKKDKTKVTGANISFRIINEFLEAVKNGKEVLLRWPVNSNNPKITKLIKAQKLWDVIVDGAYESGCPGLMFWDRATTYNAYDCYADLGFGSVTSNPCLVKDTWIMTDRGPQQIQDLIGTAFNAIVDGQTYSSSYNGFYPTTISSILKISTDRGYNIKCTPNHLIKIKQNNKTSWKSANKLELGDILIINNVAIQTWEGQYKYNFYDGWLIGSLLGDGCFVKNKSGNYTAKLTFWEEEGLQLEKYAIDCLNNSSLNFRKDCGSGKSFYKNKISIGSVDLARIAKTIGLDIDKSLNTNIEKTSSDFYCGFLRGWFDADGTVVISDTDKKSYAIRLASSKLDNLHVAQRMLARLGIISTIYLNRQKAGYKLMPDGNGGNKSYYCQPMHELHISKQNMKLFANRIGFGCKNKQDKLQSILNNMNRGPYKETFTTKVTNIELLQEEQVYDTTIHTANQFDANGLLVHNCSEIIMCPDTCRLIVQNLLSYVVNPFTKNAYFNFELFAEHTKILQRLADDIVDAEEEKILKILEKIESDPEPDHIKAIEKDLWLRLLDKCRQGRRTGSGTVALADTLAALGLKYDSDESLKIIDKIFKTFKHSAFWSSVEMAKELGPFPIWDWKYDQQSEFLLQIQKEDPDLFKAIKKYGRRNIGLLTMAPTGTVALMAQTSSGIEPLFNLEPYIRRTKITDHSSLSRVDFIDQNGDKWKEYKVYHPQLKRWMEITGETDITKSPWYGACANDIDWIRRIEIQSIIQTHIDHSISSTINLPHDVSKQTISDIYLYAWEKGLKGITIYRDGSKTGVLVREEKKNERLAPKRPKELPCDIYSVKVKGINYFVIIGLLDNKPYEVFAGIDGNGDKLTTFRQDVGILTRESRGKYHLKCNKLEISNINDYIKDEEAAITRLLSTSLRHSVPLEFIVHQLEKVPGDMNNFARAVSRVLKKYIKDGTEISGENCLECGGTLIRQEGCMMCQNCGYSKCN